MASLTIKQETFCLRYVETGNATDSYRQAYGSKAKPETISPKASRLLATDKIRARVGELRKATLTDVHGVTIANLIAELEEARQVGKGREQAAAMVAATMGKAKLAGLDKDAGDDDGDVAPVAVIVQVKSGRRADA